MSDLTATVAHMAAPDDDMSWFHTLLTPDEQATLLSYPSQALPTPLVERLMNRPGVTGSWWVASSDPVRWSLAPEASRKLSSFRRQLDQWWQHLTPEQQTHITANRTGRLTSEYAHVVHRASGTPPEQYSVCLISDANDGDSFRLPPMISAYVDMVTR